MAELHFEETDGEIRISLPMYDAIVEGNGKIRYFARVLPPGRPEIRAAGRRWLRVLRRALVIATAILAVAVAVLYIWKWKAGFDVPAFLDMSANIFSIALLGSLVSLGGLSVISLENRLDANEHHVAGMTRRCPFIDIVKNNNVPGDFRFERPGNPRFCMRCPLGIDIVGDERRNFLIHRCAVYDELHREWRRLPGVEDYSPELRNLRDNG